MYEYQEVLCLGVETIELLIDQGLFLSYIKTLSNLYLQSIDLSDQECREQQKELAGYFIESGNGFFLSRRNLTSMFSQVLQKVFPNGGIDIQTIGLLPCYDKISSYVEIISSFTTEPDYQVERITMMLDNMEEDIIDSLSKFMLLGNRLVHSSTMRIISELMRRLAEDDSMEVIEEVYDPLQPIPGIVSKTKKRLPRGDSMKIMTEIYDPLRPMVQVSVEDKGDYIIVRCITPTFRKMIREYHDTKVEEVINKIDSYQISDESIEESKTIGLLSQCGSDFLLTQSDFQSSCHEIIHQIFDQIYKQSKKKQSVNSELKDSSVSALSQKASKLNVIG